MGNVSVENPVELANGTTVLGRPFFSGWEVKSGTLSTPSTPNQVLKDVSVGGTVAQRKAKAYCEARIWQF